MINQLKRPVNHQMGNNIDDGPTYGCSKRRMLPQLPGQCLDSNIRIDISTFYTTDPSDMYFTQPLNTEEWKIYEEMQKDSRYLDKCEHPDLFRQAIKDYQRNIYEQSNYDCEYMYFYR